MELELFLFAQSLARVCRTTVSRHDGVHSYREGCRMEMVQDDLNVCDGLGFNGLIA